MCRAGYPVSRRAFHLGIVILVEGGAGRAGQGRAGPAGHVSCHVMSCSVGASCTTTTTIPLWGLGWCFLSGCLQPLIKSSYSLAGYLLGAGSFLFYFHTPHTEGTPDLR